MEIFGLGWHLSLPPQQHPPQNQAHSPHRPALGVALLSRAIPPGIPKLGRRGRVWTCVKALTGVPLPTGLLRPSPTEENGDGKAWLL